MSRYDLVFCEREVRRLRCAWPCWSGSFTPIVVAFAIAGCLAATPSRADEPPLTGEAFPPELVEWVAAEGNPVFIGGGETAWDKKIRERGWILKEGDEYHLWYTGYDATREGLRMLGYAASRDGRTWQRSPENPLDREHWIEDMQVLKDGDTYYMFAEGKDDVAHLLTSRDRLHWQRVGPLDIRLTSGEPISAGPRGTPTVWIENGVWHLFYERGDKGVWLATSRDRQIWTNVSDDPVIAMGPAAYDKYAVALNQVIKHKGRYYGFYHASDTPEWKEWSTCIATSRDLVHWEKYGQNPLLKENKSSGIVVGEGEAMRLYTMHPVVQMHVRKKQQDGSPTGK